MTAKVHVTILTSLFLGMGGVPSCQSAFDNLSYALPGIKLGNVILIHGMVYVSGLSGFDENISLR